RRRRTTVVAAACAVVVAVGAGFTLTGRPDAAPPPTATAESPAPSDPRQLAATALAAISDDRPAFEVAEPVTAGYEREERMYLPRLLLTAACAGTGQATLVVMGDVENDLRDRFKDREMARLALPCSATPKPVTKKINASMLNDLTFRLEQARGTAGFAYRVTGERSEPVAPNDPGASVEDLVGVNSAENARAGGAAPENEPFDGKFRQESGHAQFPAGEVYNLVMACRGVGVYALQIRRGGRIVAEHSVECSKPPRRQVFQLAKPLGKNVEFWGRYRADQGQKAETAWSLQIR
ncbi:hypothetical protein AB0F81_39735, partial [Actinoplanes sp. NPDC024001]|uniref:hypothetical protein n=1 Tax=Actinoplanes sp. NPDC024001 TaxID=3154598 RepID=UPI0033FC4431